VKQVWHCPFRDINPCRRLDWLLQNTARFLKSWSDRFIGSVRTQLAIAKEVLHCLAMAHDRELLAAHEESLRQLLKLMSLGLSPLQRTMARQESRLLWLSKGDAAMCFFHTHANAHRWKNHIHSLDHEGRMLVTEADKADAAFHFNDDLLGSLTTGANSVNLDVLGLLRAGIHDLFVRLSEEEICQDLPPDKVLGLDGFTTRFLQVTWPVIRGDIMHLFDALWQSNTDSMHTINHVLLVLLPKTLKARAIRDYRLIALIHVVGKLISKVLGNRLAPLLDELIHPSQSAFIKGQMIHDNFRFVQGTTRLLSARRQSCLLLKVDITKAFDSVAWPFLIEVMEHAGFTPA
jgi:hypothetical protein